MWIAEDVYTPGGVGATREVHRREGRTDVLLARGTDIDPAPLSLRANRFTWRTSGWQRMTTLGPAPA